MKNHVQTTLYCLLFLVSFGLYAQQSVSGVVTDVSGTPLPAVNVVVKGTTTGISTDFDGKYQLSAKVGDVLEISYVGYATQSVTVGTSNTYNVSMALDNTLEEVVVIGQGFEKERKSLGYSVSSVDDEEIEQRPEGDIGRVLNGKVAGLNVTSSNGLSGSSTNMVIRGYSSATQT